MDEEAYREQVVATQRLESFAILAKYRIEKLLNDATWDHLTTLERQQLGDALASFVTRFDLAADR